jgi:hypothetical protein
VNRFLSVRLLPSARYWPENLTKRIWVEGSAPSEGMSSGLKQTKSRLPHFSTGWNSRQDERIGGINCVLGYSKFPIKMSSSSRRPWESIVKPLHPSPQGTSRHRDRTVRPWIATFVHSGYAALAPIRLRCSGTDAGVGANHAPRRQGAANYGPEGPDGAHCMRRPAIPKMSPVIPAHDVREPARADRPALRAASVPIGKASGPKWRPRRRRHCRARPGPPRCRSASDRRRPSHHR